MYSFYGHVKSYAPPLVWGTRKKVKTHLELTVLSKKGHGNSSGQKEHCKAGKTNSERRSCSI